MSERYPGPGFAIKENLNSSREPADRSYYFHGSCAARELCSFLIDSPDFARGILPGRNVARLRTVLLKIDNFLNRRAIARAIRSFATFLPATMSNKALLFGGENHFGFPFAASFLGLMSQLWIHVAVHHAEVHLKVLRWSRKGSGRCRGRCNHGRLLPSCRTRHVLGIAARAAGRPHAAHRHLLVDERVRVHRGLALDRHLENRSL